MHATRPLFKNRSPDLQRSRTVFLPLARTGQNTGHSTRHRTNVRCISSTRAELNREQASTGQKGTGQNALSAALSGAFSSAPNRLGLATGQNGVAPYMSGAFLVPVSGASHLSVASQPQLPESAPSPDKSHRTKTLLSGALSGALQSTFLNSFCHPCSQPLTPKCSITLCTCVSVSTSIFSRVLVSH